MSVIELVLENTPERFGTCVIVSATGGSHRPHDSHFVTNSDHVDGTELRSTVGMQNDFARVARSRNERHADRSDDEVITHVIINRISKNSSGMLISDRTQVGNP